uniref:Gag-Pol polyprotein n=1 Tax=Tanacetum cinerariifolium TaxID=118510 RepID=A0A6L2NGH9_TANCI|nr:Gag-Pol polyprotein [Tanacetum cinerariifolium]
METTHAKFDELTAMAFEHDSLEPIFQRFINDDSSAESMNIPSKEDLDNLFEPIYEEYFKNSTLEPKNIKEAMSDHSWIESMQDELHQFERLDVWELVPRPDEEVYVSQLDGIVDPDIPNHVYRLKKALYSLKQAPRAWYDKLSSFLIEHYFTKECESAEPLRVVRCSFKRQDCTVMSTAEAKYVSLTACCAQVIWMRTQLLDYGYKYNRISMYYDSNSVIAISCNPVQYLRTKHIDIRYHFIKEHVEKGTVELYFVGIEYQLGDLFTKALPKERFEYLAYRIELILSSNFRTTGLVKPWQTLCKMFSRCLTIREGLYYSLEHPSTWIPYLKFIKLIVSYYMTSSPEILRRARDKYHNLADDMMVKNIFNSRRHKDGFGIKIPSWMITDDMKLKNHDELEAKQNVQKVKEHLITEEIEKLVEGTENVENVEVDSSTIRQNDNQIDPDTRLEPRNNKEILEVKMTVEVQPVNINEEVEKLIVDDYKLKGWEKGRIYRSLGIHHPLQQLDPLRFILLSYLWILRNFKN